MKTFAEIGTEVGELVERKNAAYGSSFAAAGDFLRLLYPQGLRPEQYGDALLLVRIFDKQKRIATDRDALGESPYQDIAGYGILGAHLHQQRGPAQLEMAEEAEEAEPVSTLDLRQVTILQVLRKVYPLGMTEDAVQYAIAELGLGPAIDFSLAVLASLAYIQRGERSVAITEAGLDFLARIGA